MLARAVIVNETGGPEVLTIGERPVREPGAGEVLVRVTAATVNPADFVTRTLGPGFGRPGQAPPPWTPGMEGAGVVESRGDGSGPEPGTPVAFALDPDRPEGGAQAELVVVPVASLAVVPPEISDVQAATLPMNGLTALMSLAMLDLKPGQTLGVTGATGALGGYVVQLGHRAGLRVVATARPADEALLRELGADVVVPRTDDVAADFRGAVPEGVDGLVDAAVLDAAAAGAVRDGGAMVSVHGWAGPAERDVRVLPVFVASGLHRTALLEDLMRYAAEGTLTPRVARELRPDEVGDAHRRLAEGGLRGRQVLRF